jgi:hypothetical protein
MKVTLLALLVACTPVGITTTAEHPANPDAPVGRLAGPPPALAPGVADLSKPAPVTLPAPAAHTEHAAPEPPAKPPATKKPAPKKPAPKKPDPKPPAHQGHEGHH